MKLDVIRAIEACYAGEEHDDVGWLRGIVEALAPLDQGRGMLAQVFRMERDGRRLIEASFEAPTLARGLVERVDAFFTACVRPGSWGSTGAVDLALRRARCAGAAARREVEGLFSCDGVRDALGILAAEPDGRIALVVAPIRRGGPVPAPRTLHLLKLFSAHLGASMRLRRAIAATAPEAVLDPAGRLLDATPSADRAARDSLAEAVRRLGRARGTLRHTDPEEAIRLWHGLVEGRWSLVDRLERDGRRYVLARRNDPAVHDPKALTERERAVVAFAALGHPNKFIAYALGLCPSAVAAHLGSARRKLRLGSRAALVREFAALVRAHPDPGA